ncbi:MAG: type II secretion system protein [Pseudomonadales bacterium]
MAVKPYKQRGFTLIELILFIVIVGVATTGLFSAINSSTVNNVNPLFQVRSLELAQAQMDEIFGKRYDDKSPSGGFPPCGSGEVGAVACDSSDSKTDLSDVDDYHGFTTVPTGYGGYTMNVVVADVTLNSRPAKLITITVDSSASTPVTLSAFRGNF